MVASLLLMFAVAANGPVESWTGFLGGEGVQLDASTLPLKWSPTENQPWVAAIPGFGQSSPAIWQGRAFVTSVEGPKKDELIVSAYALADGKQLWSKRFPTSDPVTNGTFVSRAAPTPVVDKDGIYSFFESGDVVALSHAGEELWKFSLANAYGKFTNEYGLAASPVQTADSVIILIDHPQGDSYLISMAKKDGSVLWKTDRTRRGSWTSPRMLTLGGKATVVCSSAGTVDGYDPATGTRLWSHEGIGGNRICTPSLTSNGLLLIGSQTSREFPDADSVKKSNIALQVGRDNSQWSTKVAWRTEDFSPGMASPMAHQGFAYWINRQGAVGCFRESTGEQVYSGRVAESPWATPLGVGDRIYVFGKDGLTTVLAAGERFEILAENRLWDPMSVKPDQSIIDRETDPRRKAGAAMHALPEVMGVAAVNGSFLVRTGSQLHCLRYQSPTLPSR
ncbi:MAG: PQQ-binding-like beta-propeller repeat protein [Pirellulales bacterium]